LEGLGNLGFKQKGTSVEIFNPENRKNLVDTQGLGICRTKPLAERILERRAVLYVVLTRIYTKQDEEMRLRHVFR